LDFDAARVPVFNCVFAHYKACMVVLSKLRNA